MHLILPVNLPGAPTATSSRALLRAAVGPLPFDMAATAANCAAAPNPLVTGGARLTLAAALISP
eukprot:1906919-Amphidinium_carterae.1